MFARFVARPAIGRIGAGIHLVRCSPAQRHVWLQATFIFEFGDCAETTGGTPTTETPVAKSACWMKRRREVTECVFLTGFED